MHALLTVQVSEGDLELAYSELNKIHLRPFLTRIWGQQAEGAAEVAGGATATTAGAVMAEGGISPNSEETKVDSGSTTAAGSSGPTKDFQPGDLLKGINIPDTAETSLPGPNEEAAEFEFSVRESEVANYHITNVSKAQ